MVINLKVVYNVIAETTISQVGVRSLQVKLTDAGSGDIAAPVREGLDTPRGTRREVI
jgi:hypothetical protein